MVRSLCRKGGHMTLGELIGKVTDIRGIQYSTDILTGWVNELEAQVVEKIINREQGVEEEHKPLKYERDAERELLVPDVHEGVYLYYIFSKMDILNQETELYQLDSAMWRDAWQEYGSWHLRTRHPRTERGFRGF